VTQPERVEPKSVTLGVCTKARPHLFANFTRSVEKLTVPGGVEFLLAVADNNPESQHDLYVGELLGALPFKTLYGHEPKPGYANARNKALELALKTDADLLAFVDDDMMLDRDWLLGHLQSYREFDCDVVGGAIKGGSSRHKHGRRFAHGEFRPTIGTCNVSFRRWLAADDGLGLRFDPTFNKTGGEDKAFFAEAHRQGAKIVVSAYPVVHHSVALAQDLKNEADVSVVMQRNKVARLRNERGFLAALGSSLWGVRFGLKSLPASLGYVISSLLGAQDHATRKKISAYKNFLKMIEGFKGLSGDCVDRSAVRRDF